MLPMPLFFELPYAGASRSAIVVPRPTISPVNRTLLEILQRVESLGPEIEARMQSEEYLGLVRKAFRVWDQADTSEKRRLIQNLLTNAGGTPLTVDDVVRLFIQWIDFYHEAHFAVIKSIHGSPGCTRGDMWDDIHGAEVRGGFGRGRPVQALSP